MISIKNQYDINKMKISANVLVNAFKKVKEIIEAGIKTKELDRIVEEEIKSKGGIPAFKGYRGFPASICVSIDEEVVHGLPGDHILQEGEIVSIDMGVELDGYFSDAAVTYGVGRISNGKKQLLDVTRESLYLGIDKFKIGNRLSDISNAIQKYTESKGYSVVRDLVGHGIGTSLHEEPQIPNFGVPHRGPALYEGMVFAIEPMINMGDSRVEFLDDGWTVRTVDRMPSAHFEHTVLLSSTGAEILTKGIN